MSLLIESVNVSLVFTGQEFDVRAKCVINATGPFTDALRKMDNQEASNICQPSAGVHIVIPGYYRSEIIMPKTTKAVPVVFFFSSINMYSSSCVFSFLCVNTKLAKLLSDLRLHT